MNEADIVELLMAGEAARGLAGQAANPGSSWPLGWRRLLQAFLGSSPRTGYGEALDVSDGVDAPDGIDVPR
jgi:hypothetical protein